VELVAVALVEHQLLKMTPQKYNNKEYFKGLSMTSNGRKILRKRKIKKYSTFKGKVVLGDQGVRKRDGYSESIPRRNKYRELIFKNSPDADFKPNLTPKEVLQAGSFGGTYFRPIHSSITGLHYDKQWKELPQNWIRGLNAQKQVYSSIYRTSVNENKVKCGGSLDMWESSGWIKKQDPYGWFQWYCRFYLGRRTSDDKRQIKRWKNCTGPKGRFKNNLIGKIYRAGAKYNSKSISPVIRQVLLHWGYRLTKRDYEARKKVLKK